MIGQFFIVYDLRLL